MDSDDDYLDQKAERLLTLAGQWEQSSHAEWVCPQCGGTEFTVRKSQSAPHWAPQRRYCARDGCTGERDKPRHTPSDSHMHGLKASEHGEQLRKALEADEPEHQCMRHARDALQGNHTAMKPGDSAAIVEAMRRWSQDAALAAWGCRALTSIAEKNREAVTGVGGMEIVAEAMERFPDDAGVQGSGMMFKIHILGHLALFTLPSHGHDRRPQQRPTLQGHPGTTGYPPGVDWPKPLQGRTKQGGGNNRAPGTSSMLGTQATRSPGLSQDHALEERRRDIAYQREREYIQLPAGRQWPVHLTDLPQECMEMIEASRAAVEKEEDRYLDKGKQCAADFQSKFNEMMQETRDESSSASRLNGMTLLDMQNAMKEWKFKKTGPHLDAHMEDSELVW